MHVQLTANALRFASGAALSLALVGWGQNARAQTAEGSLLDPNAAAAPAPAEAEAAPATAKNVAPNDGDADALIASLGQGSSGDAATEAVDIDQFKLNIYGFTDFTYSQRLNNWQVNEHYPTFMVGKVNFYVGAELGKGWRALTEFRLMYEPNGYTSSADLLQTPPPRVDTTAADPADFGRPVRWGGVAIERAWLEYTVHPLLTIQMGQWLTPYGIWIVDHGSPVIIGVRRPYVVGEDLFPEHQTGVQIYGSLFAGRTEVGYHLALSNGRGPLSEYQDLDNNKAVTARLFMNTDALVGTLSLGASMYRGRYTDRYEQGVIGADGKFNFEWLTNSRYEELGMSADLRWMWDALTVQAELIVHDTAYGNQDKNRPVQFTAPGQPPAYVPDFRSVGWYVMGAYRLPWYNIMPFFGGESYHPNQALINPANAVWGGINWRPIPRVVLKAQLTKSWFHTTFPFAGSPGFAGLDLQAAWSF
jgi:hypothetical protein